MGEKHILLVVVALKLLHVSSGYPSRVPESVCGSMQPSLNKHQVAAQTSASPYSLTTDRTQVQQGDSVTVTVGASSGLKFRGIILQARTPGEVMVHGHFSDINETRYQTMTCFNSNASTVTHNSRDDKLTPQTFTWIAPDNLTGDVHFFATIVQELETYWMNVTSHTVTVREDMTTEPDMDTTTQGSHQQVTWKIYKAPTSGSSQQQLVFHWMLAMTLGTSLFKAVL